MPEQFVGPPGMSEADARLVALKAHRKALDEAIEPTPGRESLIKALLPVAIAQGIDFLSTEKPLGFNRRDDMYEAFNKFPGARAQGFGGTIGRIGSGALELALVALLHRRNPTLARAYSAPSATLHTTLASDNWKRAEELDRAERLRGKR